MKPVVKRNYAQAGVAWDLIEQAEEDLKMQFKKLKLTVEEEETKGENKRFKLNHYMHHQPKTSSTRLSSFTENDSVDSLDPDEVSDIEKKLAEMIIEANDNYYLDMNRYLAQIRKENRQQRELWLRKQGLLHHKIECEFEMSPMGTAEEIYRDINKLLSELYQNRKRLRLMDLEESASYIKNTQS